MFGDDEMARHVCSVVDEGVFGASAVQRRCTTSSVGAVSMVVGIARGGPFMAESVDIAIDRRKTNDATGISSGMFTVAGTHASSLGRYESVEPRVSLASTLL